MISKLAIDKAISAGWRPLPHLTHNELCAIALDATFWQSLGKALGPFADGDGLFHLESPRGVAIDRDVSWADYTAHRFYDLILTDVSTEEFWAELLSNS